MRLAALFALLAACPAPEEPKESGTPEADLSATAVATSECLDGGGARGPSLDETGGTGSEFSMTAEVSGDDVVLHLSELLVTCCPTPGASVAVDGGTIRVDFTDSTSGDECDCMCPFDFDVTIPDVPAGTWTVELTFEGGSVMATEIVTVG